MTARAHRDGVCLDADDVAAFLHCRLDPALVHVLDQHVAACSECRMLLSVMAEGELPVANATPDSRCESWSNRPESVGVSAVGADGAPCDCVAAIPPGRAMLGAYRLLHKLGEGGMGTVYVGEHTLLGRRAAIKLVRRSLSDDEVIVKRFFHEARAVSQIADPGIIQIFDFGYHTDGSAFIVMELLEGEPMDQRLARIGRFGLLECLRLVRLLGTSLGVAHARGIIHRDLKPANIFLVNDPAMTGGERLKILDFGIAKLAGDESADVRTLTGTTMGTPAYMSPEQCRGVRAVDQRADIYAMGCVMFAMLTGRPPFDGKGAGELIAAHLGEAPPLASSLVPEIPVAIDQILQRCLSKAPEERFPSIARLVQAIAVVERALLDANATSAIGDPGTLPPPAPAAPRARASRTRRTITGLAVATLAIAGVMTLAVLRSGGDPSPRASSATAGEATAATHDVPTALESAPPAAAQPPPAFESVPLAVTRPAPGLGDIAPPAANGGEPLPRTRKRADHGRSTNRARPPFINRGD